MTHQRARIRAGVVLVVISGWLGLPHHAVHAEDIPFGHLTCTVKTASDSTNVEFSLSRAVKAFNETNETFRLCRQGITLATDIVLENAVELKGSVKFSSGFTFDGGGHELDARNLKGECAIIIRKDTQNVTIKNLYVKGNASNPMDGICVESQGNKLQSVRVGFFGGRGIVLKGDANRVEAATDASGKLLGGSAAIYNGSYGIYATTSLVQLKRNFVDVDTIIHSNNAAGHSGKDCPATTPASSKENTSQQLCVVGDQTKYELNYGSSQQGSGFWFSPLATLFGEEPGTTTTMLMLFYRAFPPTTVGDIDDLKSVQLSDTLLGYRTVSGELDALVKAKLIGIKEFTTASGQGQFGHLFTPAEVGNPPAVYVRIVPADGFVASSAAPVLLTSQGTVGANGQSTPKIFAYNEWVSCVEFEGTVDPLCKSTATSPAGSVFNQPGAAGGTPGAPGDGNTSGSGSGSATGTSAAQQYIAEASSRYYQYLNNLRQNYGQGTGGAPNFNQYIDSDRDGIADQNENSASFDNIIDLSKETDHLKYDTDGDGLPDGLEDADKNGYVTCWGRVDTNNDGKVDTNDVLQRIFPDFRAESTKATETQSTECRRTIQINANGIPVPALFNEQTKKYDATGVATDCALTFLGIENEQNLVLDGNSLGGSKFGPGVPTRANSFSDVVCEETDARKKDTDDDTRTDAQERRHRYLDRSRPAYLYHTGGSGKYIVNGEEVPCDSYLQNAVSENIGINYMVLLTGTAEQPIFENVECRGDVKPGDFDKLTKESNFVGDPRGMTDPRAANTDGDQNGNDSEDTCPTDKTDGCLGQCFYGWKIAQIAQGAGISIGMDAQSKLDAVNSALTSIQDALKAGTISARADIDTLVGQFDTDDDDIPDLVEAGAPDIFSDTNGTTDCQFVGIQTNPFAFSSDVDRFGVNNVTFAGAVVLPDSLDPCLGVKDKTTDACKTKVIKYKTSKIPLLACYIDRDHDQLMDCEEDLNLDGDLDPDNVKDYGGTERKVGKKDFIRPIAETNAIEPDTDGDGLLDGVELKAMKDTLWGFTDPTETNTDHDGLDDFTEVSRDGIAKESGDPGIKYESSLNAEKGCTLKDVVDTDPTNPDTDGDGIKDEVEIDKVHSNPANADSDNDGLCDGDRDTDEKGNPLGCKIGEDLTGDGTYPRKVTGQEDLLLVGDPGESNPCDPNTDGEGPSDDVPEGGCKILFHGTCVTHSLVGIDSDADGIPDPVETKTGTDPDKQDTDGDGLVDGCLRTGDKVTGELDFTSGELCNQMKAGEFQADFRTLNKPDCGGVPFQGCDTNPKKGGQDTDGDTINDKLEKQIGTNPTQDDTDKDGVKDANELTQFSVDCKPLGAVSSSLPTCRESFNGMVVCTGMNPIDWDTDHDGLSDGEEDRDGDGCQDKGENPETSAVKEDSDQDGEPDAIEATCDGRAPIGDPQCAFNAVFRGRSGCSLVNGAPASSSDKLAWALLVGLPLLGLLRMRTGVKEE